MPVVIDGNNLLHSLPRDSKDRSSVRRAALDLVRNERLQIIVVFDGPPPPGAPDLEHLGQVTVRYSVAKTADDIILDILPAGGQASEWVVVTDDRSLGERIRERGARTKTLAQWRGRRHRKQRRQTQEPRLSSREVADWEAFFSTGRDDETP